MTSSEQDATREVAPIQHDRSDLMEVDRSDLQKIHDVLTAAREHHVHRDESNARLHLAPSARFSPLTSSLDAACDRLDGILRTES